MDITINNPHAVGDALNSIFNEDISGGPVRAAPDVLREILHKDWGRDVFTVVELAEPFRPFHLANPREPIGPRRTWTIRMHKVTLRNGQGKAVGQALRMSTQCLMLLAEWEAAVAKLRSQMI